jgi:hypothetical protein
MSEVKVNKISPRSGTTVTLGDSGDTFTIPSGATINNQGTATNFGATGSASWNTTVKTGDFTAVAGEGYFVDTTSQAIDVTLPAGTAGAVVAVKDYAGTFDTNKVTLIRNGSDKIGGDANNAELTTEGIAVTLVFIDSTQGWLVTDSGLQSEAPTASYICASSPCVSTVGNFKIHRFTSPGTFTVNSVGNCAGSNKVQIAVVAGGGGGSANNGGGGGGGGIVFTPAPGASDIPVSAQGYPISIGAGGTGGTSPSSGAPSGTNSTALSLTAIGGGGGGVGNPCATVGQGADGGSGAGDGAYEGTTNPAGGAATQPTQPGSSGSLGNGNAGGAGGDTSYRSSGGGGGGASAGSKGSPPGGGGPGGNGLDITPVFGTSPQPFYAPTNGLYGGGGGGGQIDLGSSPSENGGAAGPGGGGKGGGNASGNSPSGAGATGTVNTGGGGGGGANFGGPGNNGAAGGSGVVLIRYKFQT